MATGSSNIRRIRVMAVYRNTWLGTKMATGSSNVRENRVTIEQILLKY